MFTVALYTIANIEASQVPINRGVHEKVVIHLYIGMLLSQKMKFYHFQQHR